MEQKEHKFNYLWNLTNLANVKSNGCKVFSTFSCGGGSTMGYKLAGYELVGNLEIDKRKNAAYVKNHHPRYNYEEDIRKFRQREDLPEELYNLDVLDGSPPCFLEGELVMTSKGFKEIQDIQIGDYVLTHTNSFQRVVNVMNRKAQGYFELKVQGCASVLVTENHPFYVRTMIRNWRDGRIFSNPTWKPVKELDIKRNSSDTIVSQDYIGVAINQNSIVPQYKGLVFDEALLYIIGRWFGDGWLRFFENEEPYRTNIRYTKKQGKCRICGKPCKPHGRYKGWYSLYCSDECFRKYKNQRKKNRHTFVICCAKDEKSEMIAAFNKLPYNYTITEQRTTYRFSIENKDLVEYMLKFCRGAQNKRLTNDILDLPIDLLKSFLDGYLDADGCYDKEDNLYSCASISKQLIYGIQACVHKVYHTSTRLICADKTHKSMIEGRVVNIHTAWHLSFKKESSNQQHAIYEDGYLWMPYREKAYIEKEVPVYNISVENDESYTINNLICHNCLTFSKAGSRDDKWGEVFYHDGITQRWDDLFFEYIALAKRLQPKVVVAENVKGILLGDAIEYVRKIYELFDDANYFCQHWLFDASKMGVPQKRERVFFVCLRKDLAQPFLYQKDFFTQVPKIDMSFNEKPITLRECQLELGEEIRNCYREDYDRLKNGEPQKYLQSALISIDSVHPTLTEGYSDKASPMPDWSPNWLSDSDLCKIGSFPQDYDFNGIKAHKLIGRSVPPIMMAQLSSRIYEQWLSKINIVEVNDNKKEDNKEDVIQLKLF